MGTARFYRVVRQGDQGKATVAFARVEDELASVAQTGVVGRGRVKRLAAGG